MTELLQKAPFYYFVHVHKTGGLTFNGILVSQFNEDQIFMADLHQFLDKSNPGKPIVRLGNFRYTRLHFPIHPFPFDREVIYLTMLRNPIDRTLSLYKQDMRGYKSKGRKLPTLQEWLTTDERGWNAHARLLSGNWIGARGKRNAEVLIDQPGRPLDNPEFLDIAKENLENSVTFFGITEHFDDSMKLFKHTFPEFKIENYDSFNRAPKKQSVELSDGDIAMLERANGLDLQLYSFAVDLFNKRVNNLHVAEEQNDTKEIFKGWWRNDQREFREDESYENGLMIRRQELLTKLDDTDPGWKKKSIHEFNPMLSRWMRLRRGYSYSFFHWKSETRSKRHVRIEKLGELNIPDDSLDYFISLNALEFVRIHKPIFKEVMTKLRDGGKYLFTLPINKSVEETFIRVQFMPHGPEPLFPARYHKGAYGEKLIAAWEFGADYPSVLEEWIAPHSYEYQMIPDADDPQKEYLIVIVTRQSDAT